MSAVDKARIKLDDIAGKAKEKAGQATGNRRLRNEGKIDQVKANVKRTGERVKDAFKH